AARAAYAEAVTHLTKGLEVLHTLPQTPTHLQLALQMHLALGGPLIALKSHSAPEVQRTYAQAQALCQQVADPTQRSLALQGLWVFAQATGQLHTAQELAAQLLHLAQAQRDPVSFLGAYRTLATTCFLRGEIAQSLTYARQGKALYDTRQHRALAV